MEGGWRAEGGETDQKVLREPETRLNLENMRKRVRKREKQLLKLKLRNSLP